MLPDEGIRESVQAGLQEKTADLHEASGAPVNFEVLADCLRKGFERNWGVSFKDIDSLSGTGRIAYG